jgi:hypothetical protein
MAELDDSYSKNPWNHPDDPHPLLQLEIPPPTEAAGSDNLAESAIQEATVQQQQPEQQQLLEDNIDMSSLDSQIPGPRDSQIPGSRDSQMPGSRDSIILPDSRLPGYWKRLAELAEGLSPLSEISEEPDDVPLDVEQNADSAIDEFMEDPGSPRATSLASTTSLAPHIEGDIDWDVLMAAETGMCTGERGPRIPDEQTPLLTSSSSSHSTLLPVSSSPSHSTQQPVIDSEHTDDATVDSEPTIRPTAKRYGPRGGKDREFHAACWNRSTPPRGPPPARIAQAQGGTNDASLGRQSKARPSKRPCRSTRE